MSNRLVDAMDVAWASSSAALAVTVDPFAPPGAGAASNTLVGGTGVIGTTATFTWPGPGLLDLSAFDEIRFWLYSDRPADGSAASPYYLEFFFIDASAPGVEYRWFVPINAAHRWEHRYIGLKPGDVRGNITSIGFRVILDLPFTCHVDELMAVREEMVADAERALAAEIARGLALPGLTGIPTTATPAFGAPSVTIALTPGFAVGNRVRVSGAATGDEEFQLSAVTDNTVTGTTTLVFDPGQTIGGTYAAPAIVSLLVPVIVETSATPTPAPSPAVIATMLDMREDLVRTGYFFERDSFRSVAIGPTTVTVCSVRPAARAYVLDYQLSVEGSLRDQQLFLYTLLAERLSMDVGLRINGDTSPVWILPSPTLRFRRLGELAPMYLRIGTHLHTAPRVEETWVRHTRVQAGHIDARHDWELVEVDL